jgi:hypothetical protein
MILRYHLRTCSASLAMLGALLLYAAGAVLHPLAHAAADAERRIGAVEERTSPEEAPAAPANGEQHENCAACKLTRAAAMPALSAVAEREVLLPHVHDLHECVQDRGAPTLPQTLPRAPPYI